MKNFWRHILRNKTYAFINLFGLSLGLTVTTLIILYVQREFDYDNYLPGYDRVIRIQPVASSGEYRQEWAASEGFLVPALTGMFEEIEAGTRIMAAGSDLIFRRDSLVIAQKNVILADENFFDVLPYSFVYGDRATALRRPDGIVLARSMAEKLFGPGNPVGRILTTSFSTFQVTGVIEEIPERSHLHFSAVFPLRVWIPDADQSRQMYAFYSYLRLKSKEQVNPFILNKLAPWYAAHGYDDQSGKRETEVVLGALPIADIHLRSHAEKELEPNGQLQIVYLFVAVAALVLIIATLNYVNLSNALAIRRSREVAIRKTVGASRQRLFVSFMTESALFTLAAFLLSLALDALLLSRISFFGGPALTLSGAGISYAVLIGIAVWLMLGLLAGLYPATVLSSFDPIQALRAAKVTGRRNGFAIGLRRGLIVFQFAISSFMVVCAFTIRQQMLFIEGRDLGFDKDHVLTIPLMDDAQ
ncbi:MAG TPA: ABC transporter permease, partial [Chryseolinea sp.]|nr:ABC transporter permease [Chryseolinea sp.]